LFESDAVFLGSAGVAAFEFQKYLAQSDFAFDIAGADERRIAYLRVDNVAVGLNSLLQGDGFIAHDFPHGLQLPADFRHFSVGPIDEVQDVIGISNHCMVHFLLYFFHFILLFNNMEL
jgi:hypothetical protein